MSKQFNIDLANARSAEHLVLDVFTSLTDKYSFEFVGDNSKYYHKGDIIARAANGEEVFIEVKNDSRIAATGNILCEEENYFKFGDYWNKGNMYSDY